MRVFYVSTFDSRPNGNGATHRSYQVAHDLNLHYGKSSVHQVNLEKWWSVGPRRNFFQNARDKIKRVFREKVQYRTQVDFLSSPTWYWKSMYLHPGFVRFYGEELKRVGRPDLCIVDSLQFVPILKLNQSLSIPTVICAHNIDSFAHNLGTSSPVLSRAAIADFRWEMAHLSKFSGRFFISKVEAGFIGGLGLASVYYPYQPVGEIQEQLVQTRIQRAKVTKRSPLFLMVGSMNNGSTRNSFHWLYDQFRSETVPDGIQIVIAGFGTDPLSRCPVRGVEVRGAVSDGELHELLVQAKAVLVPQINGFGALTRVAEFACAGIPIIMSGHPRFAIDLPPQVSIVDDTGKAWIKKIREMADVELPVDDGDSSRAAERRLPWADLML